MQQKRKTPAEAKDSAREDHKDPAQSEDTLRRNPRGRPRWVRLSSLLRRAGVPRELARKAVQFLVLEGFPVETRPISTNETVLVTKKSAKDSILDAIEDFLRYHPVEDDYDLAEPEAVAGAQRRRNPDCVDDISPAERLLMEIYAEEDEGYDESEGWSR